MLINMFTPNHVYLCPNRFLVLSYCIFGIHIKFATFSKKLELHSLSISEIIDSERCDYLNA